MKKYILLYAIMALSPHYTHGMTSKPLPLHVLTIPGQKNYSGIDDDHVREIFGEGIKITKVGTPKRTPDFGQDSCLSHLKEEDIRSALRNDRAIFYARSQGTATALNYIAHNKSEHDECQWWRMPKALVLEGVVASGNSAIHHTARNDPHLSALTKLPFSYYWLPYLAKVAFLCYQPGGQQPITSPLWDIPFNLPIIIAHAKDDPQVPYAAACALYYRLARQTLKHPQQFVYLISKKGSGHTGILDENDHHVIRAILQKHGVMTTADKSSIQPAPDLKSYQPDHDQFEEYYDELIGKEKKHVQLGSALRAGACAAACYVLNKIGGFY